MQDALLTSTSESSGALVWGCTFSGVLVISDEVFTGLSTQDRVTSISFIDTPADLSVLINLPTRGLLPPPVTPASEHVFNTCSSNHKSNALLHGHYYIDYTVACQVTVESLLEL